MNMRFFARRKIDPAGRVSIPSTLMRELELKNGDLVDLLVTEHGDILVRFGFRKEEEESDGN